MCIWQGVPFEGIDRTCTASWSAAVERLTEAGVRWSDENIALVTDMAQVNAKGGFAAVESYSIHRERLQRNGAGVDPNIRVRIERGAAITASDLAEMTQGRQRLVAAMDARFNNIDALVLPTTAIAAPKIVDVSAADEFGRKNAMLLRNTNMINFFDLCAISLPLPLQDGLSTGLMLVGRNGQDGRLFRIAAAVEHWLKG